MHFLLDMFQMTTIAFVSIINHYHINGLHLFWDTLYIKLGYFYILVSNLEMKVIEILKYFLPFTRQKLPSFRKIFVMNIILPHAVEK